MVVPEEMVNKYLTSWGETPPEPELPMYSGGLMFRLGYNPHWKNRKGNFTAEQSIEGNFEGEIDGKKVKIKTKVGTKLTGGVNKGAYGGRIEPIFENEVEEIPEELNE